jgi:hypothetical protein
MACDVRPVEISASLDTRNQTHEQVIALVEHIFRVNGVIECGLMGHVSFTFGQNLEKPAGGDPGPELKKLGVTSLKKTEIR